MESRCRSTKALEVRARAVRVEGEHERDARTSRSQKASAAISQYGQWVASSMRRWFKELLGRKKGIIQNKPSGGGPAEDAKGMASRL